MRRPTLSVIATSAVLGAIVIAVPALAASGSSPTTAHSARARSCDAVIVLSHGRRLRACLIQGPRGYKGFNGVKGTTGSRGATGKTGPKGAQGLQGVPGSQGPAGTARAYAVITPSATAVSTQSLNITAVTSPKSGIYCITPAAPISPSTDVAAVSAEVSYSTPETPGLVALNAQRKNCATGAFEVDTYAPGTLTLAGGYAFTLVIP